MNKKGSKNLKPVLQFIYIHTKILLFALEMNLIQMWYEYIYWLVLHEYEIKMRWICELSLHRFFRGVYTSWSYSSVLCSGFWIQGSFPIFMRYRLMKSSLLLLLLLIILMLRNRDGGWRRIVDGRYGDNCWFRGWIVAYGWKENWYR